MLVLVQLTPMPMKEVVKMAGAFVLAAVQYLRLLRLKGRAVRAEYSVRTRPHFHDHCSLYFHRYRCTGDSSCMYNTGALSADE